MAFFWSPGESCLTAPVDCRKDCFSDNQCVAEEGQANGHSVLSGKLEKQEDAQNAKLRYAVTASFTILDSTSKLRNWPSAGSQVSPNFTFETVSSAIIIIKKCRISDASRVLTFSNY